MYINRKQWNIIRIVCLEPFKKEMIVFDPDSCLADLGAEYADTLTNKTYRHDKCISKENTSVRRNMSTRLNPRSAGLSSIDVSRATKQS